MREANYKIVEYMTTERILVIRDIGPWDRHKSVTNDAEGVVKRLRSDGLLPDERRLFYFDSHGRLDEIVMEYGEFKTFRPIPQE